MIDWHILELVPRTAISSRAVQRAGQILLLSLLRGEISKEHVNIVLNK